ncbi:MAG TPA: DoxX family protein [Armatimonadota bacterium]
MPKLTALARRWAPYLLSLLRIVVAALFLEHGLQKLWGFPGGTSPVPLYSMAGAAGVIETVGGLLLLLGLFTRAAAFVLSGEMAVAYFMVHAPHSFYPVVNRGELAVLYCFVFLYFVFAGGGPWSVDAAIPALRDTGVNSR